MAFGNVKVDTISSSTRTINVDDILAGGDGSVVTFVAASGQAPLSVSGSPVTSSGTITISLDQSALSIAPSQLTSGALPSGVTVASTNIVDGTIVNDDISSSASIDPTKISGVAVVSGDARLSDERTPIDGSVTNAKVASGAAIELSKLADGALPSGITIASVNIIDGTIVDGDISNSANINPAKISGVAVVSGDPRLSDQRVPVDGSVTNAKVASGAAIELSKLANGALPSGITVASANIVDGTIVDADINASAAIALTKLASGTLPSGIAIASGTQASTNLSYDASSRALSSSTGSGTTLPLVTSSTAGLARPQDFGDVIVLACSDETTDLATGTARVTFRMPWAATLTAVRLSVNTAPTGSALIVDVNEAGASVFSTRPQIDASAKTSVGSTVTPVISDASLAADAEITVDIDQVGSTIKGKGLKVALYVTRA